MSKKALINITQEILEEMGSDSVNSISDTIESTQVAGFIRQAFTEILDERNWSFTRQLGQLGSYSDPLIPTTMKIPDEVHSILWIKYNNVDIVYKDPKEFYELINGRDTSDANVDVNGYRTDINPSYYTSYDDADIVFDSYDSAEGSTLLESNTAIYFHGDLTWTHEDAYIAPLPSKFFKYLELEARSQCWTNIIKAPNPKVEQALRRKRAQMQSNHSPIRTTSPTSNENVNYGR